MNKMNKHELKKWLSDKGSKKDNLSGTDFSYVNLSYFNLSYIDLSHVDLTHTDLNFANLKSANLSGSNLTNANLNYANLNYSDLSNANLSNIYFLFAIGNNKEIKTIQAGDYVIVYTETDMAINCEQHSIEDWFKFDDKRILEMGGIKALKFWNKWKPILKQINKEK